MAGVILMVSFYANNGVFPTNNTTSKENVMPSTSGVISSFVEQPIRSGYNFIGWSLDSTSNTVTCTMNDKFSIPWEANGHVESFSLYAVWEASTPTITFDANSGTFLTSGETQSIYNSTELTGSTALSSIVETPTKPGYIFQGWSITSTGAVQYTQASKPNISSDTTLYAIYEPDTTKVILEKGAVDIILGKLK